MKNEYEIEINKVEKILENNKKKIITLKNAENLINYCIKNKCNNFKEYYKNSEISFKEIIQNGCIDFTVNNYYIGLLYFDLIKLNENNLMKSKIKIIGCLFQ